MNEDGPLILYWFPLLQNLITMKNAFTLIFLSFYLISFSQSDYFFLDGYKRIYKSKFDGTDLTQIIGDNSGTAKDPIDLELDLTNGHIYWIDGGDKTIRRSNLDGSNEVVILDSPDINGTSRGLALDLVNQHIYFSEGRKIKRCDLGGTNTIDILEETNSNASWTYPNDVEVDPVNGKLYWDIAYSYSTGSSSTYYVKHYKRSNLNGTSKQIIANHSYTYTSSSSTRYYNYGFDIDVTNQKFYYSYGRRSESSGIFGGTTINYYYYTRETDMDGSNPVNIQSGIQFNDLEVDEVNGKVYCNIGKAIYEYSTSGGGLIQNYTIPNTSNLKSYDIDTGNDKLIFSNSTKKMGKVNIADGTGLEYIRDTDLTTPLIVDYDEMNDWVYWMDGSYVARIKPDGSGQEKLIDFYDGSSIGQGLFVDEANSKLYFSYDEKLYSSDLDGNNNTLIYTSTARIENIKVDAANNRIYWSRGNNFYKEIEYCELSGLNHAIINMGPTDFFDFDLNLNDQKIYWITFNSSNSNYEIRRRNLDGSNEEVLRASSYTIETLITSINGIYWTESQTYNQKNFHSAALDGSNNSQDFTFTGTTISSMAVNVSGLLPVELGEFYGKQIENKNHLFWNTLSETNNYGFEVERSENGIDWNFIGFVEGNGNAVTEINYEFVDERPLFGANYYRLRQVDYDGEFEYSNIIVLDFDTRIKIHLSPNPVSDVLTISFPDMDTRLNATIQIVDVLGRIWYEENLEVEKNGQQFEYPVSHLTAGTYYAVATIGESRYQNVQSFIIAVE